MIENQESINAQNAIFWDEPCGTSLFPDVKFADITPEFLDKFDEKYLSFYPYLLGYLPSQNMAGKRVLEIGLGYGTVGQILARSGAEYVGMDIARNPVGLMNFRLSRYGFKPSAIVGDALKSPFQDSSFDHIVSIGCLHHTGNTEQAIREVYRLLKPGGSATIMLYNSYSFRFWQRFPIITAKRKMRDLRSAKLLGYTGTEIERKMFDANVAGESAPQTEFFSVGACKEMFGEFSRVKIRRENMDNQLIPFLSRKRPWITINRKWLLPLGFFGGLDLYITATK